MYPSNLAFFFMIVKKESPNMGTKTSTISAISESLITVVKKESPNMGTKGRLV